MAKTIAKGIKPSREVPIDEIPLYHIFKDGNGVENKCVNFDHPVLVKQDGIIEIEIIRKNRLKHTRTSICVVRDPVTDIIYGKPMGVNPGTKAVMWRRINIDDFRRFDLRNPIDRDDWAIVSRAPWMLGSPFANGKPMYKKTDKAEKAESTILKVKLRRRAEDIIEKMSATDMYDIMLNLGRNPESTSVNLMQAELLEMCEKSPKEFVNVWENSNRNELTVFKRALATGLIVFNPNAGYMYKNTISIGITEEACIGYLKKNETMLSNLDFESKQRSPMYKTASTVTEKKAETYNARFKQLKAKAAAYSIPAYEVLTESELEEAILLKEQQSLEQESEDAEGLNFDMENDLP